MKDLWDVYIWPIDNAGYVRMVAKAVEHKEAQEIYDRYFNTNSWDAYMVPAGTKLFIQNFNPREVGIK